MREDQTKNICCYCFCRHGRRGCGRWDRPRKYDAIRHFLDKHLKNRLLQVAPVDGKADVKDEDDKKEEKKEETQEDDTNEEKNED